MSDAMSFSPLWGEWYLKELIGKGTFGAVYRAEKTEYGNTYTSAVKHIAVSKDNINTESLIAEGIIPDESALGAYYDSVRDRMISEINFCYALRGNTNIVSYEDHCIIEKPDDIGYDIFIRMEYLSALPKYMKEHSFGEKDVVQLGIDICQALEVLDRQKMIHRDIKPANIFVNSVGVYKLGDFGESKVLSDSNAGMTVRGTYTFMSPEISRGSSADIRSDLYSLGIVMYRLLNGNKAPFVPADSSTSVNTAAVEAANVRRFSGEKLPLPAYCTDQALAKVIMKACEFLPSDRYQKPKEMRKALEALIDPSRPAALETPPAQNEKTSSPEKKPAARSKKTLTVVLASASAVILIGLILFAALRPKNDTPAKKSSSSESTSSSQSAVSGETISSMPVSDKELRSIRIRQMPQKNVYYQNENFDPEGMVLEAVYSDETVSDIPLSETKISDFDHSIAGVQMISVEWQGKAAFLSLKIEEVPQDGRSGSCGKALTFSVDDNGTMTISGKGKMNDFSRNFVVLENNTIDVQCDYAWKKASNDIRKVVISEGVTTIGAYAFYKLPNLQEITLPETMTSIGESAFRECGKLKSIHLPASVERLGKELFVNCTSLQTITVSSGSSHFASSDGMLYTKDMKTFLKCPEAKRGSVGVANGTETIGEWAFDGCRYIDDLIVPISVTTVKDYAFSGCTGVSSVTILSNVETMGSYAFRSWQSSQTIRIYDRASAPSGWSRNWNTDCKAEIIWNAEKYAAG